jgi:hypothetical protein
MMMLFLCFELSMCKLLEDEKTKATFQRFHIQSQIQDEANNDQEVVFPKFHAHIQDEDQNQPCTSANAKDFFGSASGSIGVGEKECLKTYNFVAIQSTDLMVTTYHLNGTVIAKQKDPYFVTFGSKSNDYGLIQLESKSSQVQTLAVYSLPFMNLITSTHGKGNIYITNKKSFSVELLKDHNIPDSFLGIPMQYQPAIHFNAKSSIVTYENPSPDTQELGNSSLDLIPNGFQWSNISNYAIYLAYWMKVKENVSPQAIQVTVESENEEWPVPWGGFWEPKEYSIGKKGCFIEEEKTFFEQNGLYFAIAAVVVVVIFIVTALICICKATHSDSDEGAGRL